MYVVSSDIGNVPKGSVLINPDTGTPYLNRNNYLQQQKTHTNCLLSLSGGENIYYIQ